MRIACDSPDTPADCARRCKLVLFFAASLVLCAAILPGVTVAQTNWNVATGSWFDAGNWTAGVPTSATNALIDNDGTSHVFLPSAIARQIYIGNTSSGALELSNGSSLATAFGAHIGFNSEAVGTAIVNGAGSMWSVTSGVMEIGFRGTGELTISDAGHVATGFSQIAVHSGSDGTVTVTGVDSTWTNSGLIVGASGTGQLNILNGGLVSVVDDIVVGRENPNGSIHFNNGTLVTGGLVAAIAQLTGVGIVNTHGLVTDMDLTFDENTGFQQQLTLASEPDQNITINLDVNGSGSIGAGYSSSGSLRIADGVDLQSTVGYLGYHSGSEGIANVLGAGSKWTTSLLFVGRSGKGEVLITKDAKVITLGQAGSGANLGSRVGAHGKITLDGAGANWSIGGPTPVEMIVGEYGEGELIVQHGAHITGSRTTAILGVGVGSIGNAIVSGMGSTWTTGSIGLNRLIVGNSGSGTVSIDDGGVVSTSYLAIAGNAGSTGAVRVSGAGAQLNVSDSIKIGGNLSTGGSGELLIESGAKSTSVDTILFPAGKFNLDGGTHSTIFLRFQGTGGQFNWTSGTLHVNNYIGSLFNPGGTLAPGESAGSTRVTGSYTQGADATLKIELGGLTPGTLHDVVNVSGTTSLDGELLLSLLGDYIPLATDTFTVLSSTGELTGTFTNTANAGRLDTTDGRGSFLVHYGASSTFNPNQIILTDFALTGDYNGDGMINAADYVLWRDTDSSTSGFDAWQTHFGNAAGQGSGQLLNLAVPEPAAWHIALSMLFAVAMIARRFA